MEREPIKVAHIITGLSTGGAEMMLFKVLSGIDRSRFDTIVISLAGYGPIAERIEALGIKVYSVDMKPGRIPVAGFRRLVRLLRGLKPDIIQGWMVHGNLVAVIAGIVSRKPVVWSIRHSNLPEGSEKKMTVLLDNLLKWLSSYPKKIIYNSQAGQRYHESIGYVKRSSVVIPNGFDINMFAPSQHANLELKAELGLPRDTALIGMVGRYHPMKDHATFLNAAIKLIKTYPAVKFVLVGSGCDQKNAELSAFAREHHLENTVFLMGERKDIPTITAAIDIATSSSSSSEGFANTIGEAMSCGVPCVVTDVGDSAWIVGDTGVVVQAMNPTALAEGWARLIEIGETGRRELGMRARQRIIDVFSLQRVVRQFEAIYWEISN